MRLDQLLPVAPQSLDAMEVDPVDSAMIISPGPAAPDLPPPDAVRPAAPDLGGVPLPPSSSAAPDCHPTAGAGSATPNPPLAPSSSGLPAQSPDPSAVVPQDDEVEILSSPVPPGKFSYPL